MGQQGVQPGACRLKDLPLDRIEAAGWQVATRTGVGLEGMSLSRATSQRPVLDLIDVTPHLLFALGDACAAQHELGALCAGDVRILHFQFGDAPLLEICSDRVGELTDRSILCIVHPDWFIEIDGPVLEDGLFHLPSELRVIGVSAIDCALNGNARLAYQAAKGIELLCETVANQRLIPLRARNGLSLSDSLRIMAARKMIQEQFGHKLTLQVIGRACGLNRAKLTRGFRELFDCSIAEAIAQERLAQAAQQLRTTDKPIGSVGYAAGYLNNASFARAFAKRFGVTPTSFRRAECSDAAAA
ncbi:MAG: hypothetical protein JWM77_208 [Rhodospirillales bacterium]|nr:hypothetical protein [Rhodospirillales bacterium]